MNKLLLYILVLFVGFSSCDNKKQNEIIKRDTLVKLLVDVHLTDGVLSTKNIYTSHKKFLPSFYYNHIYSKYGTNAAQFDSTILYYSIHSNEFEIIYDEVVDSLNRLETEMRKSLHEKHLLQDTMNLWTKSVFYRQTKLVDDKFNIDIPISQNGFYTLRLDLKLYNKDKSDSPHLKAYFWKQDSTETGNRLYFDSILYKKDNQFHSYQTKLELSDSTYTHLKGNLFVTKNKGEYIQRFDIKKILIFNPLIRPDSAYLEKKIREISRGIKSAKFDDRM